MSVPELQFNEKYLVEGAIAFWQKELVYEQFPSEEPHPCLSKIPMIFHSVYSLVGRLREEKMAENEIRQYAMESVLYFSSLLGQHCVKKKAVAPAGSEHFFMLTSSAVKSPEREVSVPLYQQFLEGHVAHIISSRLGPGIGLIAEVALEVSHAVPPAESANPNRDEATAVAVGVGFMGSAHALTRISGHIAMAGIEASAAVGQPLESRVQRLLHTLEPEDLNESITAAFGEDSESLYASAHTVIQIARGLQMPAKFVHILHERMTATAIEALDDVGITDQFLENLGRRMAAHPPATFGW